MNLDKEIEALESTLIRLKQLKEHQAEPIAKWQPKGGDFFIGSGGSVSMYDSRVFTKDFGMERETRDRAERAAVEMRRFNRLLALRDDLCGDAVVDWNDGGYKYYVYFNHDNKEWRLDFNDNYEVIMPYFTTEESAQKACDMLNIGEVEL